MLYPTDNAKIIRTVISSYNLNINLTTVQRINKPEFSVYTCSKRKWKPIGAVWFSKLLVQCGSRYFEEI